MYTKTTRSRTMAESDPTHQRLCGCYDGRCLISTLLAIELWQACQVDNKGPTQQLTLLSYQGPNQVVRRSRGMAGEAESPAMEQNHSH